MRLSQAQLTGVTTDSSSNLQILTSKLKSHLPEVVLFIGPRPLDGEMEK